MPWLPLSNCFSALSIVPDNEDTIHVSETGSHTASDTDTSTPESAKVLSPRLKRWEHNLPKQFIVAASPSPNSLNLKVEIQMTDTAEVKGVTALLDRGATGLFIDHNFATVSTPTVPTEVIAASTTMAQQLAEKALWSIPAKEKELIPPYLHDFIDVFAKEPFDSLPEQWTWDHTIELDPGAKPSACKVLGHG